MHLTLSQRIRLYIVLGVLALGLTPLAEHVLAQPPALLFGSYNNAAKAVQVDSTGKLKVSCADCGGGGMGTPGGATNTVQFNAGSSTFDGVALNATATNKFLRQVSSGVATFVQVAVGDISGFGSGIATWLATPSSANLASALTDETGTGVAVFSTSPALTTPNIAGAGAGLAILQYANSGTSRTLTIPDPGTNDSLVTLALAQSLTNKTLVTPTIASFTNATHNHSNAAGGGQISETAFSFTNITTANATSAQHGLMPKGSGSATDCYLGDLTVAACPSVGGGNVYDYVWGDGTKGRVNARGAITTSDPIKWTQTWNAVGTTFSGVEFTLTRTASANGSKLFSVTGGASGDYFSIIQDSGDQVGLSINAGTLASVYILPDSGNNLVRFYCSTAKTSTCYDQLYASGLNIMSGGQTIGLLTGASGGRLGFASTYKIGWQNSTTNGDGSLDTTINRTAAGVVAFADGTSSPSASNIRDTLTRHALGGGTAPTAGTCATSPTIAGTDEVGRIAVGTSPSSTCVVNFGTAYTNAPVCLAENETTSGGSIVATETTSAVTFTQYALSTGIARNYTAADSIAWHCKSY